ncbi:hypothetical protein ACFQQB_46090 [Nonomuraea rubra]|uniref:hypothetical protein n=1 Tax=Nonomuraea rubra TaxID=46180 RepID=UPI00361EED7F
MTGMVAAGMVAAGMVAAGVLAHGVGERADLPIPIFYAYAGAFAALVVSFLALGLLWADSRFRGDLAGRPITLRLPGLARRHAGPAPPGDPAAPPESRRLARPARVRLAARVLTLLAAAYTLGWLVLGPEVENAGPYLVYVLFWVGLVPASLLLGPVWRVLNPFRLLPDRPRRPYPSGLGYRPAAAGLLAFTWMELVAPEPAAPPPC